MHRTKNIKAEKERDQEIYKVRPIIKKTDLPMNILRSRRTQIFYKLKETTDVSTDYYFDDFF